MRSIAAIESNIVKIALIIEHADAARGGAERYTMQLAAAMVERGHQVKVLAREGQAAPAEVELIILRARSIAKTTRYARFLQLIDQHLKNTRYDIVHAMMPVHRCDLYHPHAGLTAEAIARGHLKHAGAVRRRLTQAANRIHIRRRFFRTVERKLVGAKNGPVIACVSELVKREVRQHYPLPDSRLAVLFNAIDLERFDPSCAIGGKIRKLHKIPPDKTVALMIAQNFRLKGLAVAIEGVASLHNPNLVLLVVGKESAAPYQRQARGLGIANQIIFAGPTTDAVSYYADADFFVLPTLRDSCSLVVLEALAMGVPVISTTTNGACEIMQNGKQGFVLNDPTDVSALAAAMNRLMDQDFRQSCSAECQKLRPRLSFDEHVRRIEDVYNRLSQTAGQD